MSGVFYLVGPTGSGKSALAAALAGGLEAEIVNGDAFQLYRGLEILTAAPTTAERARAPHHLYGVLAPTDTCDAARYAVMARDVLAQLAARGKNALVVGGSGLYVKALTHGLSPLPTDAALRQRLAAKPLEENVAELQRLDPAGAAAINLTNPRYVERALELCLLTGQPASALRAAWSGPDPAGLRGVCLHWPRETLYPRLNARTETMFAAEVVEEVARLGEVSATVEKTLGLREVRAHLAGELSCEEAVARIQQATRHYAKRQMTWFRRERWLTMFAPPEDEKAFPTPGTVAAVRALLATDPEP